MSQQDLSQEIKELIILRLEESSDNRITSFGLGSDEFTKEGLIDEVRKGSDIGKKIMQVELNYLRALAGGDLLRKISEY